MTTFYLIRHAEREGDQQLLAGRTPGLHLSERGQTQAQRLAYHLTRESIERVYASPIDRARETAERLARVRGLTVEICEAINEIDSGEWTGKLFSELDLGDDRWRRFNHFRSATPIPRGESGPQIQGRFVGEMLRLRAAFPTSGIALVSHADPIKIALAYFLGAPLDLYDRIDIGLASVSVITVDDWGAKVTRVNDQVSAAGT